MSKGDVITDICDLYKNVQRPPDTIDVHAIIFLVGSGSVKFRKAVFCLPYNIEKDLFHTQYLTDPLEKKRGKPFEFISIVRLKRSLELWMTPARANQKFPWLFRNEFSPFSANSLLSPYLDSFNSTFYDVTHDNVNGVSKKGFWWFCSFSSLSYESNTFYPVRNVAYAKCHSDASSCKLSAFMTLKRVPYVEQIDTRFLVCDLIIMEQRQKLTSLSPSITWNAKFNVSVPVARALFRMKIKKISHCFNTETFFKSSCGICSYFTCGTNDICIEYDLK